MSSALMNFKPMLQMNVTITYEFKHKLYLVNNTTSHGSMDSMCFLSNASWCVYQRLIFIVQAFMCSS